MLNGLADKPIQINKPSFSFMGIVNSLMDWIGSHPGPVGIIVVLGFAVFLVRKLWSSRIGMGLIIVVGVVALIAAMKAGG